MALKKCAVPFEGTAEQEKALKTVIAEHKDDKSALMPVKERNRSIDILRAIAIVLVVLGHSFPIPGCEWWQSHFSAGSYRMALFLFISGYLFRDIEWSDLPSFVWRKTKNLVFPLIGWNIVYAGIVSIINFRHPVNYLPSTEQVWNMHDLFIEPFITGHQYLDRKSTRLNSSHTS